MRTYILSKKNITDAEAILESQESFAAARIAYLLALEERAEECIRIADHIACNFDGNYRDDSARISALLAGEPVMQDHNATLTMKLRCGETFYIGGLQQTCSLQAGHPGTHKSLTIAERV